MNKINLKRVEKETLKTFRTEIPCFDFNHKIISDSVEKTGRLFVLDGGWGPCGISAEVIASVSENINPKHFITYSIR